MYRGHWVLVFSILAHLFPVIKDVDLDRLSPSINIGTTIRHAFAITRLITVILSLKTQYDITRHDDVQWGICIDT